jgi:energy-coupling factor transport system substrate-specific component
MGRARNLVARDLAPRDLAPTSAIRLRPKASVLLVVTSVIGVVAFGWPLLIHAHAGANLAHSADAPWLFVAILPLLLAVVLGEMAEGSLDAKAIALLGILAACGSALRVPSPGVAGFEPVFFLLIPSGRVLGRGFGFVLGAVTIAASALITGGIGPWLPFQMFGAAWMGFGAGCLPPARGRAEILVLAAYAAVSSVAYGTLLNLWFWPFGAGTTTSFSFVPGAGLLHNLHSFVFFDLTTSLGFDLTRALTNTVLVLVLGRPVLAALRRASRRAAFDAEVVYS